MITLTLKELAKMDYDYTSKDHLRILRGRLVDTTDDQRAKIFASTLANGIMLPRHPIIKIIYAIAKWRDKANKGYCIMATVFAKPGVKPQLDLSWTEVLDHMSKGKDTSDPKSAGGWNRDELDLFVTACRNVGAPV